MQETPCAYCTQRRMQISCPTPDPRRPTLYFQDSLPRAICADAPNVATASLSQQRFAIAHNEEMKIPLPRRPTPDARRPTPDARRPQPPAPSPQPLFSR